MALRLLNLYKQYTKCHISSFKITYQINKTHFRMATNKDLSSTSLQSSPVAKTSSSSLQQPIANEEIISECTEEKQVIKCSSLQDPTFNTHQDSIINEIINKEIISNEMTKQEEMESSSIQETINKDQDKNDEMIQNKMEGEEGSESQDPIETSNQMEEEGVETGVDEKYSYFQRGFTSEIYKIEIGNLPPVGFKVYILLVILSLY